MCFGSMSRDIERSSCTILGPKRFRKGLRDMDDDYESGNCMCRYHSGRLGCHLLASTRHWRFGREHFTCTKEIEIVRAGDIEIGGWVSSPE